jgi:hypothetical protein
MHPTELREAMLDTLIEFEALHFEAQQAVEQFKRADADLDLVKATLLEAIAGETEGTRPRFSNEERRRAELARRLHAQHAPLVERHAVAERARREHTADLERAHEALKTYRVVAQLRTAELELEAARLRAATAATPPAPPLPAPAPRLNTAGACAGKKGGLGKATVVPVPGVDTDALPF